MVKEIELHTCDHLWQVTFLIKQSIYRLLIVALSLVMLAAPIQAQVVVPLDDGFIVIPYDDGVPSTFSVQACLY